ncbi:MAG: hypothetical protein F4Z08_09730 [Chloroflexi bacterium]|nr:hypothetical protein [Chloroflexota bacterium]
MFIEPRLVVALWMGQSAVVRLDQQPDEWLPQFIGKECAGALVIGARATTPSPSLTLKQIVLPLAVRLPRVGPAAGVYGDVPAAEQLRSFASHFGDVPEVFDEELPLAPVVRRVRVER